MGIAGNDNHLFAGVGQGELAGPIFVKEFRFGPAQSVSMRSMWKGEAR